MQKQRRTIIFQRKFAHPMLMSIPKRIKNMTLLSRTQNLRVREETESF